jgi:hypothetical protein
MHSYRVYDMHSGMKYTVAEDEIQPMEVRKPLHRPGETVQLRSGQQAHVVDSGMHGVRVRLDSGAVHMLPFSEIHKQRPGLRHAKWPDLSAARGFGEPHHGERPGMRLTLRHDRGHGVQATLVDTDRYGMTVRFDNDHHLETVTPDMIRHWDGQREQEPWAEQPDAALKWQAPHRQREEPRRQEEAVLDERIALMRRNLQELVNRKERMRRGA